MRKVITPIFRQCLNPTCSNIFDVSYARNAGKTYCTSACHTLTIIKNPKSGPCMQCSKPLTGYGKKFCDSSCAATYNSTGRVRTAESKKKLSDTLSNGNYKYDTKTTGCVHITFKTCLFCSKLYVSHIHKRKGNTCSEECRRQCCSLAGRKSAAKQNRRSKDEIKLFEMCATYFQDVRNNIVLVDGWDADIIIDDFQLAILWNGPWHRIQMPLNNHSLKQVQNRDRLKTMALESAGWKVIVFDDDQYTPISAFDFLKEQYLF